eukprot:gene5540-3996_t
MSLDFDAYVVLDFEATCEKGKRLHDQEIIEFPLVVVDAKQAEVVTQFQRYVRPQIRPQLSPFCTELTGIPQAAVDQAEAFPTVARKALSFLKSCHLEEDGVPGRRFCFVTCGDWDLRTMLPQQYSISERLLANAPGETLPALSSNWRRWCNIKHFASTALASGGTRRHFGGIMELLAALGLPHQGRLHSGLDDCINIASIVCEFLRRGLPPIPTNTPWGPAAKHLGAQEDTQAGLPWAPPSLDPWTDGAAPYHPVPTASPPVLAKEGAGRGKKRRLQSLPGSDGAAASRQPVEREYLRVQKDPALVKAALEPFRMDCAERGLNAKVGDQVRISKAMTHLLRHSADEKGVKMSSNGFVLIKDLIQAPGFPLARYPVAQAISVVAEVVESCSKQRFCMAVVDSDRQTLCIAANQGHSIPGIEPEMRQIMDASEVRFAIHGTNFRAWEAIKECGYLSAMGRLHIHFAKGLPKDGGVISGMRSSARILLYLDVAKALQDNVVLLESANGVILTPGMGDSRQLPLKYISKVVDITQMELVCGAAFGVSLCINHHFSTTKKLVDIYIYIYIYIYNAHAL